jgi:hypothetical protein
MGDRRRAGAVNLEDGYISVPGWRKFQHYDPLKRAPVWVKDHLDQLDREEFLELSFAQRGLLRDLRNLYAKSRQKVRSDPAKLSRRLGQKVRKDSLEALVHAGFIDIVASPTLADGYHPASEPASAETEVEKTLTPTPPPVANYEGGRAGIVENENGGPEALADILKRAEVKDL